MSVGFKPAATCWRRVPGFPETGCLPLSKVQQSPTGAVFQYKETEVPVRKPAALCEPNPTILPTSAIDETPLITIHLHLAQASAPAQWPRAQFRPYQLLWLLLMKCAGHCSSTLFWGFADLCSASSTSGPLLSINPQKTRCGSGWAVIGPAICWSFMSWSSSLSWWHLTILAKETPRPIAAASAWSTLSNSLLQLLSLCSLPLLLVSCW